MFFTGDLDGKNLQGLSLILISSLQISKIFSEIPKGARLVSFMLSFTSFSKAHSSEVDMRINLKSST